MTLERLSAMVMDTKLRVCIVERGASHENRIVKIDVTVVAALQILDQSLTLSEYVVLKTLINKWNSKIVNS